MRIPYSMARVSAASLVPGRNADTFEAPPSAAMLSAVLKAVPIASGCTTASGPMWPLE